MRRGQSMIEYVYLLAITVAALLTMAVYMRRGFQGNWRSQADQLGEQYSPGRMTLSVNQSTATTSRETMSSHTSKPSASARTTTVSQSSSNTLVASTSNTLEAVEPLAQESWD